MSSSRTLAPHWTVDPTLHLARLRLADSLRLNHRNDEAATEYTSCLNHNPDDTLAHLGAGQNALIMGDRRSDWPP